jgi:23S rRNA (adenine2030-N6)-methyltransferase
MNYRHAFHAGNHGDVLKHAILARILHYMTKKDAPLAVLDAHAGIGLYDLNGLEAFKTGEWRSGIGRLLQANLATDVAALLAPYLDVVRKLNAEGSLIHYPGSPEVALHLLRKQDRLVLNELHPADYETLAARYGVDRRVQLSKVDAGQATKAVLPFLEKRGLVLIDPPFEVTDESDRVARMVRYALQRMATVCIAIWYPVTTQKFADDLCSALPLEGAKSALRIELLVREPREGAGLAGSGLVVLNPPWTLFEDCKTILPALAEVLGEGGKRHSRLEWIAGEKVQ